MAIRAFHPGESVMIPADRIVGVRSDPDGWFIPQRVIEVLTRIEFDSLVYMLGQRLGWDGITTTGDPRGGITLRAYTPGDMVALRVLSTV